MSLPDPAPAAPALPSGVVLRGLHTPADYGPLAEVLSLSEPDWPVTPELLEVWDDAWDPALFRTERVAEVQEGGQEGRVVGMGRVSHDDHSFEEWRYWGNITVHPQQRGRGIGAALYRELLEQVQARGARELRTMLSDQEHHAPGRAFLEARGWTVAWERFESRLNTADVNLGAALPLLERVAAEGIELHSVASLAADPERNRRLWELDWLLFQDVPMGTVLTKRPLEAWVKQELEDPTFSPELSFIAVRPGLNDPQTGDYVGYSSLMHSPSGAYVIGMTGVRREDRGRGVAKALKVAAMQALHGRGGGEIRTFNDPPNVAMLGMNRALGFVRGPTHLRYELKLAGADAEAAGETQ